jgi:molybdopterin-guanine dinucleotide biosynthesis protein A
MAQPERLVPPTEPIVSRQPPALGVSGVILSGGRGFRMGGVDKGWVRHAGRPLIEHVVARLRPQVSELLISANRNIERYAALGYRVVPDEPEHAGRYLGPLAGMLAGLRAARTRWVIFAPCDAPALPSGLVAALAGAGAGARPALASCGGRREPVFCLLGVECSMVLADALARGERRPDEVLRRLDAVEVAFDDPDAFANVNTPAAAAAAGATPAHG